MMNRNQRYVVQRVSDGLILTNDGFNNWEDSCYEREEGPDGDLQRKAPDSSLLVFVPLADIRREDVVEKRLMAECFIKELTEPHYSRPAEPPYQVQDLQVLVVTEIVGYAAVPT